MKAEPGRLQAEWAGLCDELEKAAEAAALTAVAEALRKAREHLAGGRAESFAEQIAAAQAAMPAESTETSDEVLIDDPEIAQDVVVESTEQLTESESLLLRIEQDPHDAEALSAVFRCFHTIKGLSGFLALTDVEALAHASEDLLDQARRGRRELSGQALEEVFAAVDVLRSLINEFSAALASGHNRAPKAPPGAPVWQLITRIRSLTAQADGEGEHASFEVPATPETDGDFSFEATAVDSEDATEATVAQSPEVAKASPAAAAPQVAVAGPVAVPASPKPAPGGGQGAARAQQPDTIRIDAERLDLLVDMIGELVITQSMLKRAVQAEDGARDLERQMGRLDKITRELHELAGSLRMVPVRATFQKMARLARDVGKKSGKRVNFQITGEDTELDKSVVDRIGDPLVHMIRNAIDHGLESDPADRKRLGKSETGRVDLRAYHRGGSIYVEVEDDGRGLDRNAIIMKAVARGLIREGEVVNERDVLRLICAPGFSTAASVTSISGRGVGMDVVKKHIDLMGGALEISSELGKGTRFSMQLPLTLAVIDGLVVRVGQERYIVPSLSVVRLVTPEPKDVTQVRPSTEVLSVRGQLIGVMRLERLFDIERKGPQSRVAVLVEADGVQAAIFIDELIGRQQAVIKGLGEGLGVVPGISGCAILPDGRLGLVLDVGSLMRLEEDLQRATPFEFETPARPVKPREGATNNPRVEA
ncbi:MAG: chemotaxis protein CheA [Myxococcales bacterium]|nr:chemotaxis protein CheA [Myxococcales bacterium]